MGSVRAIFEDLQATIPLALVQVFDEHQAPTGERFDVDVFCADEQQDRHRDNGRARVVLRAWTPGTSTFAGPKGIGGNPPARCTVTPSMTAELWVPAVRASGLARLDAFEYLQRAVVRAIDAGNHGANMNAPPADTLDVPSDEKLLRNGMAGTITFQIAIPFTRGQPLQKFPDGAQIGNAADGTLGLLVNKDYT